MHTSKWIVVLVTLATTSMVSSQSFYFGADLSYVNEMEDCGATYTVNEDPQDAYTIFKDHGCNLVRLRLWHTPSWYDQLNDGNRYSDLNDVMISIGRAKAEG
ncbi:MAG TPA: glycosyl hydrolase 53 family protein, partial [Saprospiraceae bacterium]